MELGSNRFAQREAAERALTGLGWRAISALKAAESNPDSEIRVRAESILKKVEGTLLTEPTMMHLDFTDAKLSDVVFALNQQTGLKLQLLPASAPSWEDRRITIRSGKSLPFWQAIDSLCQVGSVHYVFGGQGDFDQNEATVPLYDGFAAHQGKFADRGPFRIQLASLHCQSEVHLNGDPIANPEAILAGSMKVAATTPQGLTSRQFFLQVLVGAEPRLAITPSGPVQVFEATDDQGRSLVMPSRGAILHHESGYLGVNTSPLVHLRVDLAYPDGLARRLKRIKGSIPLNVSTRKPDPIEISLAIGSGQSVHQNGVTITLGELRLIQPDQPPTIELTIKARVSVANPDVEEEDAEVHAMTSPQQLEVLDAAGRTVPWFPSSSIYNGEEVKLTLTLLERAGTLQPTTIRYHRVIRDRVEVPFEFRDIPLP